MLPRAASESEGIQRGDRLGERGLEVGRVLSLEELQLRSAPPSGRGVFQELVGRSGPPGRSSLQQRRQSMKVRVVVTRTQFCRNPWPL